MSDEQDKIIGKLLKLGLEKQEAQIYLLLLQDSPKSVLDISRELKIGRNIVYRLIDKLEDISLVEKTKGSGGTKLIACDYQNLNQLLTKKELEFKNLKQNTQTLFGDLSQLLSSNQEDQIRYYHGPEGLSQISLNTLKAETELYVYEIDRYYSISMYQLWDTCNVMYQHECYNSCRYE